MIKDTREVWAETWIREAKKKRSLESLRDSEASGRSPKHGCFLDPDGLSQGRGRFHGEEALLQNSPIRPN